MFILRLSSTNLAHDASATRLDRNDAKAVQVFHTKSRGLFTLSYDPPCGDVDLYFNGAEDQPGCKGDRWCAHVYGAGFLIWPNLRNNAPNPGGYR